MIVRLISMALILAMPGVPAQESVDADPEYSREINARVLAFARSKLGEKVGDGQCTGLVIGAIEASGAERFPPHGPDADYVWGEYVARREDVRPGDILQFRDAVFRSKKRIRQGNSTIIRTETRFFPHHSAVVDDVREGGRILVILQQNAGSASMSEEERQKVQRESIDMDNLQEGGWVKAYHPVGL